MPTTFNFLGPLANPAHVKRQAVGVSDETMATRMLGALRVLGTEQAMVFHGDDGLDELTTSTTSTVHELVDGEVRSFTLDPLDLGIPRASADTLAGGDAPANATAIQAVLAGEKGSHRDIAVLNTAAALVVAGLAPDLGARRRGRGGGDRRRPRRARARDARAREHRRGRGREGRRLTDGAGPAVSRLRREAPARAACRRTGAFPCQGCGRVLKVPGGRSAQRAAGAAAAAAPGARSRRSRRRPSRHRPGRAAAGPGRDRGRASVGPAPIRRDARRSRGRRAGARRAVAAVEPPAGRPPRPRAVVDAAAAVDRRGAARRS